MDSKMVSTFTAGTPVVVKVKDPHESRTLWLNYSFIAASVLIAFLEVLQSAGMVVTASTLSVALIAGLNAYMRYGTTQPLTVTNNMTGPIAQVGGETFTGPTQIGAVAGGTITNVTTSRGVTPRLTPPPNGGGPEL